MNISTSKTRGLGGLTSAEVTASRAEHGANVMSSRPSKSFIAHFISNLGDPVIKILLCALGVNLFFVFRGGDILETVGIAISIFLAAFISTLSERGGESAFKRLSEECSRADFRVRRDGRICSVPIADIVVGDLVLIGAGEQIPADGLITSGRISVDQSSMTGESREIEKYKTSKDTIDPNSPSALFRGCTILSGEAEMTVLRVGDKTFLGEI